MLNKFDTQVPFAPDEPEPGSHTAISTETIQELHNKGNVSTGMTVESNEFKSERKTTRRIPKRR